MPKWESYDVEVDLTVKVKADGKTVSCFTVYGSTQGCGSNEKVQPDLPAGVQRAIQEAANYADELAWGTRRNRRRELGYPNGD